MRINKAIRDTNVKTLYFQIIKRQQHLLLGLHKWVLDLLWLTMKVKIEEKGQINVPGLL